MLLKNIFQFQNDFLVNFEQIKLVKDKNFILEIGFGLGENILFQATTYPKDYFIVSIRFEYRI